MSGYIQLFHSSNSRNFALVILKPDVKSQTTQAKTSRPDSGHGGGKNSGERSESRTSHTGSQAPGAGVDKTESSETPTRVRFDTCSVFGPRGSLV